MVNLLNAPLMLGLCTLQSLGSCGLLPEPSFSPDACSKSRLELLVLSCVSLPILFSSVHWLIPKFKLCLFIPCKIPTCASGGKFLSCLHL